MYLAIARRAFARAGKTGTVNEFVLQRGKERFGQGIIPAHAGSTHGRGDVMGGEMLGELRARELRASVGVKDGIRVHFYGFPVAMAIASATRSVRMCSAMDQPTTPRVWQSMTVARYSHPSQVRMYVMSPTSLHPGRSAVKSRCTWSPIAGAASSSRIVVVRARPRLAGV